MGVCPSCRKPVAAAGRLCPHCGTELPGRTRLGSLPQAQREGELGTTLVGAPPFEPANPAPGSAPEESSQPPIARRFDAPPGETWFGHADPLQAGDEPERESPERDAPTKGSLAAAPTTTTHRSTKATPAEEAWFRVRGPAPPRLRPVAIRAQRRPGVKVELLGRSLPLWGILVGIALAGLSGAALALLVPGPPALRVIGFEVTADGQDQLTVSCGGCPDGSILRLGQARATLTGGIARLAATGLLVGENRLPLELVSPDGRSSEVEVTVALAFRVSTDLRGITDVPPYAVVVVTAPRGTSVTIGGAPASVEHGLVRSRIDLGSEASGPARAAIPLHRKIPVRVLGPDLERDTQATIAASIVPLVLDQAPPAVEAGSALVLGTTGPGAEVRLLQSGRTLAQSLADPQGRFTLRAPVGAQGPAVVAATSAGRISRQVACRLPP